MSVSGLQDIGEKEAAKGRRIFREGEIVRGMGRIWERICWEGMTTDPDICYFAETNFRNERRRFGIRRSDRRYHCYLVGKTGMGKSNVLEHLMRSDLHDGVGMALLDPHGDLAQRIRAMASEARREDLIYLDPAGEDAQIPFNILQDSVSHPYLIVSGIVGAFRKVWGDSWGPRMEHILRHGLMALLPVPEATLLDLPRILTDKTYRERALWHVTDTQVKRFFRDEYDQYAPKFRNEAIAPILNKVGHFLANPFLRAILGHKENRLRMRPAMDEGKVVLVNLSKGTLGEDASALLGALLLAQIEQAALSRADLPAEARPPFYLYVDEFALFATPSFTGMLSEARKYGLSITLASQTVSGLDDDIRSAVFGNVGTIIAFQVGAEDAWYMEREFTPEFKAADFISLPRYHVFLKMMIEGQSCRPFSAMTLSPDPAIIPAIAGPISH